MSRAKKLCSVMFRIVFFSCAGGFVGTGIEKKWSQITENENNSDREVGNPCCMQHSVKGSRSSFTYAWQWPLLDGCCAFENRIAPRTGMAARQGECVFACVHFLGGLLVSKITQNLLNTFPWMQDKWWGHDQWWTCQERVFFNFSVNFLGNNGFR